MSVSLESGRVELIAGGGVLTIAGFVEAVRRIAVRGEDGDGVAKVLQTDGGVDDEAFGAADAEVGVEEDDVFLLFAHVRLSWLFLVVLSLSC